MFSDGQLIFAGFFAIAFLVVMVISYRKDIKLHKTYYKNVWIVGVGIIIAIAIFAMITFWLHD